MAPAVTESVAAILDVLQTSLEASQSEFEKAVSVRGLFLKGQGKKKRKVMKKCQCFTFPRALKKKKRKKEKRKARLVRARGSSCTLFRALYRTHELGRW